MILGVKNLNCTEIRKCIPINCFPIDIALHLFQVQNYIANGQMHLLPLSNQFQYLTMVPTYKKTLTLKSAPGKWI